MNEQTDHAKTRQMPSELTGSDDEWIHLTANAEWLWILRWVAVVGQLVTIGSVAALLPLGLVWKPLLIVVGGTAASNLLLQQWLRQSKRSAGSAARVFCVRRMLVSVMAFDIVSLTALLYFAGGIANPFCVFYLVNLSLCAVILSERWSWVLTVISTACMVWLLLVRGDALPFDTLLNWPDGTRLANITLGQLGQLVATSACAMVIIHFVSRVTGQLALTEAELRRVERERSRSEKLEALGTLAGGAAHELATPLSTIAVVAREMMRQLDSMDVSAAFHDDVDLIRAEVDHCQTILQRMTGRAGQWMAEQRHTLTLPALIDYTLSELFQANRIAVEMPAACSDVSLTVPRESLAQALRGLLQNAIDASEGPQGVKLRAHCDARWIQLEIEDAGTGMAPEVLARAGEPFFTTKEPGRGMGLGLFLTRSVIERLGGTLSLDPNPTQGMTATVRLPRF
ncbi:MAG: HAMP domain-containing histidine kinase [Planctomycetales bacterium]|nr:HAMP domain-containing histidine kinase [Planctomycetales bacterium]